MCEPTQCHTLNHTRRHLLKFNNKQYFPIYTGAEIQNARTAVLQKEPNARIKVISTICLNIIAISNRNLIPPLPHFQIFQKCSYSYHPLKVTLYLPVWGSDERISSLQGFVVFCRYTKISYRQ